MLEASQGSTHSLNQSEEDFGLAEVEAESHCSCNIDYFDLATVGQKRYLTIINQ